MTQLDLLAAALAENDVERAHRDGDLTIIVDHPRGGERLVHVMSRPRGGEIRGYRLCERGCAHVRLPAYTGHWPELDALVARVVGCRVIGIDAEGRGGVWTGDVIHRPEPRRDCQVCGGNHHRDVCDGAA